MTMEILKVQDLCKTYGKGEAKVEALKKVSFSLDKGEFAAVVGESGSGKSTLLNCIGALDTPTSGHIWIAAQGPAFRICLQWSVRLLPLRHQDPAVRRFRQPVRLEPPAPLQRSHPVPAQRRHQPLQRKSPPGVPPPLFRRYRYQQPFRNGTGNKGCGTHLKLPERTRWVYYLTIYDLPCTMYTALRMANCTL